MDKHLIIVGPTASGKSSLAIELAQRLDGEVASVDAFQVYRGLNVGTGKVSTSEMAGIPHHLLDIIEPLAEFSVAEYLHHAALLIGKTQRPLIWAGGTGLYVSALLDGLTPAPPTPLEVQQELNQRDLESLREEIIKVDPVWAEEADLENPRRIIRALGVYRATGRTMSDWQQERKPGLLAGASVFCLSPEPEVLRQRINSRVRAMLQAGWIDEVRRLLEIPGWRESQSARAIGYDEVSQHMSGEMTLEECQSEISLKTWQYARRQRTWFRKLENTISLGSENPVAEIMKYLEQSP